MNPNDNLEGFIVEFLQGIFPRKVTVRKFTSITTENSATIKKCLEKLRRNKVIDVIKAPSGFDYCGIPDPTTTKGRKGECPRCRRIKKVYSVTQWATPCDNPKCKTPAGRKTKIWLKSSSIDISKGHIKYINLAEKW